MLFLVIDYSKCEDEPDEKLRIVDLKGLLEEIGEARDDKSHKIAVYALEDCLLDWS